MLCLSITQTTVSDLVQISPEDVEKPSGESIEDNINAKYANKVNSLFWALSCGAKSLPGNPEDRTLHMCVRYFERFRRPDRPWHWHCECQW